MVKFRTQYDESICVAEIGFPPSVVQPGMSPDIAQMVRTRSVGGNLDEYEMNGIDSDAPFESEYLDFFDLQDIIQKNSEESENSAVERQNAEKNSPKEEAPPINESADNQQISE